MSTARTSWEIVLAGIAFIGIGIYLLNSDSSPEPSNAAAWNSPPEAPSPPFDNSNLPGAIVIDLEDLKSLESLKDLRHLKDLEELKNLEVELKNLDKIIEKHASRDIVKESLDQSLQQLEAELQKIESADFKVKLQDQKIYINKDYDVSEAQWTEVDPGVFVFRESLAISDLESMDLKLGFGNLNIVGSDNGQGELILRATGNVSDPAQFSKQLKVNKTISAPDASFQITSAKASHISDRINLEATLTIPKNIKVTANTSGGHINASNMANNQHLQTSGGHISLHALEGNTVAKTDGGHITGDEITGNTSISTGGGHIKLDNSSGSLKVQTGGGHIQIQEASGSISARTSGGNISASINQPDGPLKFVTSAGNVTLNLPTSITADFDISGTTVTLSDMFDFEGTRSQGSISGSVNGGGFPVVVRCEYGNVNINPNN